MNEPLKHGHGQESFETEDLSPQGVFYFMAGLAIVVLLIYFIVAGMYRFLDAYDQGHEAPVNPMAVRTGVDPRSMNTHDIQKQMDKIFRQPVLEHDERAQFVAELSKQDQVLDSYDWVDQKAGVVRIPIHKAMELLTQRGLPVLPQGAAALPVNSVEKETKVPPAQKAGAPKN